MGREVGQGGLHGDIVDRVFGPNGATGSSIDEPTSGAARAGRVAHPGDADSPIDSAATSAASTAQPAAKPLYPDLDPDFSIERAVQKLASTLGAATKVAGDLVADENLAIEGLVEGCVRARRARVTVGAEGLVQSRIDARSVRVKGTVRGNVSAEDWVEVKPGGMIRGDVRAPRVILHDGAVVTGRLDMSAAPALRRARAALDPLAIPPRPRMRKVGSGRSKANAAERAARDGRPHR